MRAAERFKNRNSQFAMMTEEQIDEAAKKMMAPSALELSNPLFGRALMQRIMELEKKNLVKTLTFQILQAAFGCILLALYLLWYFHSSSGADAAGTLLHSFTRASTLFAASLKWIVLTSFIATGLIVWGVNAEVV